MLNKHGAKQMKWAFEYQDEKGMWHKTRSIFKDLQTAAVAAGEWLEVCREHGFDVAVRLCSID